MNSVLKINKICRSKKNVTKRTQTFFFCEKENPNNCSVLNRKEKKMPKQVSPLLIRTCVLKNEKYFLFFGSNLILFGLNTITSPSEYFLN